jgi:subtilase family serine protease
VTLSASPASGSRFAGWSGGGCSGTGTCRVTINGAIGVTATFSPTSSGGSGSQPDLIVTGLSIPSSVSRRDDFPVRFNVVNQGRAPSGAVQLKIYLSRDNRLSSDDILLRTRTFGGVPAGGTVSNGLTETIPSGTSAGSYYVLLIVDEAAAVRESSESNNTLSRAVTVR